MQSGQVSWITGASSGIGEAVAKLLVTEHHKLILSARREEELERVKRECVSSGADADNIFVLPLDVSNIDSLQQKVHIAHQHFGQIDFLYNNAGVSQRSLCLDTDMATYKTLFDVDVFGQIALTKLVLPLMIEQGGGHLSVTASIAGKIGVPLRTGYCAAKHAIIGFFDALRAETAQHNIYVSTVVPGFIRTNISTAALRGNGEKFGQVDDDIKAGMDVNKAAEKIIASWKKGKLEIPVGKGNEMHALWLKRLVPKLMHKIMAKRALSN